MEDASAVVALEQQVLEVYFLNALNIMHYRNKLIDLLMRKDFRQANLESSSEARQFSRCLFQEKILWSGGLPYLLN